MKPLFQSAALQENFEKDGFVKIPLLTAAEAANLLNKYEIVRAQHEAVNIPYITTSHTNNYELIAKVDEMIQRVLAPKLEQHLQNYNLLFGNFLVKMPGVKSETHPHQDITFVDEEQYTSVNIWVGLQDIDETNGCMYFLPGSHLFMPTLRPTHNYPWAYEHVIEEIMPRVKTFTAKAGEGFVFMHSVIHGSHANQTSQPRVASVIAAYSKDAELYHYYLPAGDPLQQVQKYLMTKEAFLHFVKEQPPAKGKYIESFLYPFKQMSKKEFNRLIQKPSPLKKLFSFFKTAQLSE